MSFYLITWRKTDYFNQILASFFDLYLGKSNIQKLSPEALKNIKKKNAHNS